MKKILCSLVTLMCLSSANEIELGNISQSSLPQATLIKPIFAKQRLAFVKEVLTKNPQITMLTPIGEELYNLYRHDYQFIRQELQKREGNDNTAVNNIDFLDALVEQKFKDNMSFCDYNWIAKVWIGILSYTEPLDPKSLESYHLKKYKKLIDSVKAGKISDISTTLVWDRCKFMVSAGIFMPVITKTGVVPITVINEAWGFKIPGTDLYSYVDFAAVATNQDLRYDYHRRRHAIDTWFHDYQHAQRSGRFSLTAAADALYRKAANLYQAMKRELSSEDLKYAELAFFDIFHEKQEPVYSISQQPTRHLDSLIKEQKDYLSKRIAAEIVPTDDFNSIEQYETNVAGAKSLGIDIEGEDILEQQKSYFKAYLKGLDKLEKLVSYYAD